MYIFKVAYWGSTFILISGIPDWVTEVGLVDSPLGTMAMFQDCKGFKKRSLYSPEGQWKLKDIPYDRLTVMGWLDDFPGFVKLLEGVKNSMFYDPLFMIEGKTFLVHQSRVGSCPQEEFSLIQHQCEGV